MIIITIFFFFLSFYHRQAWKEMTEDEKEPFHKVRDEVSNTYYTWRDQYDAAMNLPERSIRRRRRRRNLQPVPPATDNPGDNDDNDNDAFLDDDDDSSFSDDDNGSDERGDDDHAQGVVHLNADEVVLFDSLKWIEDMNLPPLSPPAAAAAAENAPFSITDLNSQLPLAPAIFPTIMPPQTAATAAPAAINATAAAPFPTTTGSAALPPLAPLMPPSMMTVNCRPLGASNHLQHPQYYEEAVQQLPTTTTTTTKTTTATTDDPHSLHPTYSSSSVTAPAVTPTSTSTEQLQHPPPPPRAPLLPQPQLLMVAPMNTTGTNPSFIQGSGGVGGYFLPPSHQAVLQVMPPTSAPSEPPPLLLFQRHPSLAETANFHPPHPPDPSTLVPRDTSFCSSYRGLGDV